MSEKLIWHKVLNNPADLPEGRVQTVTAAHQTFCLSHHGGKFACLDNKCPHQGGPLGEGSIEKGYLRFEHPKKLVRQKTKNGEKKFREYDETKPKGYNIVTP